MNVHRATQKSPVLLSKHALNVQGAVRLEGTQSSLEKGAAPVSSFCLLPIPKITSEHAQNTAVLSKFEKEKNKNTWSFFYQKGPGIFQADASILCLMHVPAGWHSLPLVAAKHWDVFSMITALSPPIQSLDSISSCPMWGSGKRWRTSCYVKHRLHCCLLNGANWLRRDAERMSKPSVTVSLRWLRITSGYKSVYRCRGFKEKPQKSFLRFTWAIDMALNINQNKLR